MAQKNINTRLVSKICGNCAKVMQVKHGKTTCCYCGKENTLALVRKVRFKDPSRKRKNSKNWGRKFK